MYSNHLKVCYLRNFIHFLKPNIITVNQHSPYTNLLQISWAKQRRYLHLTAPQIDWKNPLANLLQTQITSIIGILRK